MHSQQAGSGAQASAERDMHTESSCAAPDAAPSASESHSVNSPAITSENPSTAAVSKGERYSPAVITAFFVR